MTQDELQRHLVGTTWHRSADVNDPAVISLRNLIKAAGRAMPRNVHVGADDAQTVHVDPHISGRAAARGEINLRRAVNPLATVRGTDSSGDKSILSTAILEQSRVYRAGARLIVMPEVKSADDNSVPAMYQAPAEFMSVELGELTEIDPSGETPGMATELTASAWPAKSVKIDREKFKQFGARYKIRRTDFRDKGLDLIAVELLNGIAGGLARAADTILLSAIANETLSAFSLASAAATGAQYDDLRAIIGSNGDGAEVTDSGRLVALPGVSGEFSADTEHTIIANWNKAAVCVDDSITMMAERLGVDGSVGLTCWVDLQPVIADIDYFWRVSA